MHLETILYYLHTALTAMQTKFHTFECSLQYGTGNRMVTLLLGSHAYKSMSMHCFWET
jgi:hypothetical protein